MDLLPLLFFVLMVLCIVGALIVTFVPEQRAHQLQLERQRHGLDDSNVQVSYPRRRSLIVGGFVFFVLWVLFQGVVIVPAGYVGVVRFLGQVQNQVLYPGASWVIPFAMQIEEVDTRVSEPKLVDLATRLADLPEGFHVNPKIKALLDLRRERVTANTPFDWGTAEHLAFATLVAEGRRIRLSGQDSRRGTFAHRHATIYDTQTGQRFTPLAHLGEKAGAGKFEVYDSPLSEQNVLAFDYNYNLDCPENLVI